MAHPHEIAGASHPGELSLSREKLALFYPELADGDPAGERFLHVLTDHLYSGDTRAAVVVALQPLRIAAYSDELDCVLLLGFDGAVADTLVPHYRLVLGSRLVTTNWYAPRMHVAPDAWEGPRSSGKFGTFWPLVADFLSDDVARLAELREGIDEGEWQRAFTLGSRMARLRPPADDRAGAPLATERELLAGWLDSSA
jgi:hypothetical protein